MVQMRKLDSFMKESQRLSGLASCTFSDSRSCFRNLSLIYFEQSGDEPDGTQRLYVL